jgi:hypothetical protein
MERLNEAGLLSEEQGEGPMETPSPRAHQVPGGGEVPGWKKKLMELTGDGDDDNL